MELLLIRHGEAARPTGDASGTGQDSPPLTDLGRKQAELLAQRLAGAKLDHLYASTIRRATETAEYVAAATNREIVFNDRFREIDVGNLRRTPTPDARRVAANLIGEEREGPVYLDFTSYGGEGPAEFGQRVAGALHELILDPHGSGSERVAVVAHGGFINAALCAIIGVPFTGYVYFGVRNTSISTVRVMSKGRIVTAVNDYSHLQELDRASIPASGPPTRRG
ncbi:MAG: histidine phosphatase family protein [Dehalococcoidia bacterium]